MASPVQTILSAVDGGARALPDWTEVANAVAELSKPGLAPPGAEAALVALLEPGHTIQVTAAELPHIQSPADMLRTAAIEALWTMTGDKYAHLCAQVAANSDSPIVRRVVAVRFPAR